MFKSNKKISRLNLKSRFKFKNMVLLSYPIENHLPGHLKAFRKT